MNLINLNENRYSPTQPTTERIHTHTHYGMGGGETLEENKQNIYAWVSALIKTTMS